MWKNFRLKTGTRRSCALLTAVPVPVDQDVTAKALASVATAEVGTVLYSEAARFSTLPLFSGLVVRVPARCFTR